MSQPYDVVVCGGGTAGVAAAIAAGRAGAKTLVIEQLGSLGGTQSNAWVTPMMPNFVGEFRLSRGLNIEVLEEQAKLQPPGDIEHGEEWYDPAMLPLILDRMAASAGVTCLFDATLVDARRGGSRISAVEVMTRAGRQWIEGREFIDSTGDASLSMLAGAETMGGNKEGRHQPMTLRFTMGNVDIDRLRREDPAILRINTADYVESGYHEAKEGALGERIRQAVQATVLQEDDLGYFQFFNLNGRPRELAFNAPRIAGFDPLDPFELSRAYQVGREKIARIAEFVRRHVPGFENAYVSAIAPLIGIRESRRVVGDYVLTEQDHQACRKFPDAIARNRYPVDIHLQSGTDYRAFPPGEWHDVPYRSLVVKGLDNLWVAGRCLSADFVAQSSVRIQSVCRAMGEAAGNAAALCAQNGWTSREMPYEALSAKLDLSTPLGAVEIRAEP